MKLSIYEDIDHIYNLCGLNTVDNHHVTSTINSKPINNRLNANYDFLYKHKNTPIWTNSVKQK